MKYLIGNWKANKTIDEASAWIKQVKREMPILSESLRVVLCPSDIHLSLFKKEWPGLTLGTQDCSPYGDGAYTGQVTARMLAPLVNYVILGHSERRRYFHEDESMVVKKAIQAWDNGIIPIIAVDAKNFRKQLVALEINQRKESMVMYEPPEAISEQIGPIGKGKAAPLEEVRGMIERIKTEHEVSQVLYGGSVKSDNLATILNESMIDGVLAGSASLNAQEWVRMVKIGNEAAQHSG